jgi:hypothetical protein
MALTITNHQIRSTDTPHTAELGDGGRTMTWLDGRGLTEGQAAIETAGAASQIPADCHPEVYHEESWSRVDAWAGPLGLTGPRRHYAGIRGARGRVMAWPAAGYGVVATAGPGGDEDEQA